MALWRQFYTLVYSTRGRDSVIVPIPLLASQVRIEITILTFPRPKWYRAGWINQAAIIAGKPHLSPGHTVPLVPSVFTFNNSETYYLRFKPVPYLPSSIISFYRSLD